MKPDFALNFTDTSIALLHRTAKGWLKVGETPFDAADLEAALEYMRHSALGLAPGGFTTKLVIPGSQILYTEVDISGGDEARTRSEILNALVSRTPYSADEIAWDWTRGEGRTARVAAVARETLAEAEAFAVTHKFNPVSFVAIPPADEFGVNDFGGEPWFGTTADVGNFIAAGEEVERDDAAIALIDEIKAARKRARAQRRESAAGAAEGSDSAEDLVAAESEVPEAAPAADSFAAEPPEATRDESPEAPAEPEPSRSQPEKSQAELPLVANTLPEETQSDFDSPAPFGSRRDSADTQPEQSAATAGAGPRIAITEVTPLGSVAAAAAASSAPPSSVPATDAARGAPPVQISAPAAAVQPSAVSAAGSAAPRIGLTAGVSPAIPGSGTAGNGIADPDPDEAPFAHVPENTSFPEADEDPDLPPLPHLARRMSGLAPATGHAGSPPRAAPAVQAAPQVTSPRATPQPAAAAAWSDRGDADADGDADLPPALSPAAMQAYGRSERSGAPVGAAPAVVAPANPPRTVSAPVLNGVDEAPPPDVSISAPPRPVAAPAGKNGSRTGKLTGMVTAPSIPGFPGSRKQKPATPKQAQAIAQDANSAARSLGQQPFAAKPSRGKPRFLGLILTAVLLLCLALVAAWSSLYLSSIRENEASETRLAGDQTPEDVSADDEMLADGIDPEDAVIEGETAAAAPAGTTPAVTETATETAPEPATEPAPGTALDSESPASVALLGNDDEIFLSSADAPPPAFDALSLPGPDATAEAPPGDPMPPPPFGTVYRFDENGLLLPTAAGLPTPGGYMLFEGKPPLIPPVRSAVAEAAAAAARAAAAPMSAPVNAPLTAAGNPSLAGAVVDGGTGATDTATDTAVADTAIAEPGTASEPVAQPNPELADRRPRTRPESAAPAVDAPSDNASDDASLDAPDEAASEFAGLRPRARPAVVEEASARARAETAAASLATEAEVQLASAAPGDTPELSAEEAANPSIMTISRRPAAKPKDFSRAVEAAVAAAVRAPDPTPVAAAPAPKSNSNSAVKPEELDEIDEPEVAATAAPKIPTKASVAKQATFTRAINLSKVNLIGVYGTQSNRHALVRLANGRFRKVQVGDKIDGGQVKAITANEVRYQKGGRLISLEMPKG